jgi:putative spermidine/putrescine transport system ATP-binding protein
LALSTRIAIFDRGELLQIGKPSEVYERPASRFVAEFLGEINLLPLTDLAPDVGCIGGRFESQRLTVPGTRPDGVNGAGILAIRPEHLSVTARAPENNANALRARIESATYLGGMTRLKLRTAGGTALTLSLASGGAAPILAGDGDLWITWPAEQGFLLPAGEHV